MLERIKYLMKHGYLKYNEDTIKEYETVVRNMLTARNLLVRISITGEIESSVRFKNYFELAREKEISTLFRILAELEDN